MHSKIIDKTKTGLIYMMGKLFNPNIEIDGCPIVLSDWNVFDVDKKSKINIGRRFAARKNSLLECKDGGEFTLGDNVFLNRECIFMCLYRIHIGNRCIFGHNVKIYDHDHSYRCHKVDLEAFKYGEIVIEDDCWVGAGCIILRGTHIGKGSVIGAGTVLKGEIPDNSIVKADRNLSIEYNNAS